MGNELYSLALKTTLDEIQKLCPEIKNAFIFREDREVIAADESTSEKTVQRMTEAIDGMLQKTQAIDGIEEIVVDGSKGRVNVSSINRLCLVTVTSKKADLNYVNTLTKVLVPTVLRLLEKISPASLKNNSSRSEFEPEISTFERVEELGQGPFQENETKDISKNGDQEPESKPETIFPEPPVSQFLVEDLKGLFAPSDTARVDNDLISQWKELYKDKEIEEVEIETFSGKSTRCKIKPIKDSKFEGKGKIQMPEKIQQTLEIRKGELVRVKPIVE